MFLTTLERIEETLEFEVLELHNRLILVWKSAKNESKTSNFTFSFVMWNMFEDALKGNKRTPCIRIIHMYIHTFCVNKVQFMQLFITFTWIFVV